MATKKSNKQTKQQNQTFALSLDATDVQQLNLMLGELPAKFANPIFQFFNLVQQKRKAENEPQPPSDPPLEEKEG